MLKVQLISLIYFILTYSATYIYTYYQYNELICLHVSTHRNISRVVHT